MKNKKQNFFYFSKTERNGAFGLLLASILLFILPAYVSRLTRSKTPVDFSAFRSAIDSWESAQSEERPTLPASAALDPNTATFEEIISFGISGSAARNLISYREKIGPFRKKEDLQKLYRLSAAEFSLIEPFLRIGPPGDANPEESVVSPVKPELFPFDPNTASAAAFSKLGLPERTVGALVNYRQKGGRFRKIDDLKKIYTLSEDHFNRIAPFVRIDTTGSTDFQRSERTEAEAKPAHYAAADNRPLPVIDINLASAEEWTQLRGIGKVYAGRIVNFREKLGGFCRIDQVAETFGLPDSTFLGIRPQLQLSSIFRKLDINTADQEQLKTHPYLNWKQAAAIVSYREQHGAFGGLDDLRKVLALPAETLEKIAPYLSF